jgi:hypothetical protein
VGSCYQRGEEKGGDTDSGSVYLGHGPFFGCGLKSGPGALFFFFFSFPFSSFSFLNLFEAFLQINSGLF